MSDKIVTKEIKSVDIVKKLNPTDYVFAIQDGKIVKITLADFKKS
jgi:hypothetical protein